ncbi:PBP1A family penicillin-binding protein [Candidatus Saganbacteria bacterium]|nr:PBP1A family penicillin-binding protein [Candidatus Saganbacteria bacterium]
MAKKQSLPVWKGLFIGLLIFLAVSAGLLLQIIRQLPDVETINSYLPSETTLIFSADGKVLARLHQEENRQVVPLSKIFPFMQNAVVATEDPRFYYHHGLDFGGIFRATIKNLIYGRVVEGGSTLTQQLAKNLFLNRRKTVLRKLAEAILAMQIEKRYTKEEILELYLNQVYFGHNAYGIESAANIYFGKSAAELNLAEAAMLAGIIRGPELYSPYHNFNGAKSRQIYVINKMLEFGLVNERDAKLAAIQNLDFSPKNLRRYGEIAPYFISYILQQLINQYGEEMVYHGGLRVYTTLDTRLQSSAENIITRFVSQEGQRYNFTQAALVSIDPRTGNIKVMVGGADFFQSKFNHAVQAKRQPGSAFKPFVYTAAMEQGISPGTILMDTPTTFHVYPNLWNPDGTWQPKNFDRRFNGPVTLRTALERSLNIPAIKLMERVGIPAAIDVAKRLGITSHLEPGLALTLGVSEVSLLELTSAYTAFANSGIRVEPAAVLKIDNRDGVTIFKQTIEEKHVLDPNIAAVMVDLLKGVIARGTGAHANIGRPAAAKTGTTENFHDAWFIGFVPQLVTGVWVGNDDNRSMKGVAEVAVCPRIWKEYNLIALAEKPALDFSKPEGLVNVKICVASGKLAGPNCPEKLRQWAAFWSKDAPTKTCDIHKSASDESQDKEENNETIPPEGY